MALTKDPQPPTVTLLDGNRPFDRNIFDPAIFDVPEHRLVALTKDTPPPAA